MYTKAIPVIHHPGFDNLHSERKNSLHSQINMLEKFAELPHFWPNYHFDYIFEGVNIFYYLLYKPEFSTSPPPHHHTTPRRKIKSPIHTDQPQTKSFRGTLKIHLLSSVPPSNTQYQIQHICKSDTEECISIRTGGEIKISFPISRIHYF